MRNRILRATLAMTRQCWEQGMLSYALMRCGETELHELIAYDMVLRQSADGRLCNVENTPAVTDSAFCIPAVWALERYRAAAERNVHFLLHDAERTEDGVLYHMKGTGEIWADSAAFLPYSLAISGHPDEAYHQMTGILDRLYLPETGLYAHIWDESARRFLDERAWGVGDGWILTGLLRTALALDSAHAAQAKELLNRFRALLERMLALMTARGGFRDVLDDPDAFEESETAAMVAVSIYVAVREGILPKDMLATAEKIRAAVLEKVDERGLVRDASSSPAFDRPGTSVECQAHMLMMEHLCLNVK